MEPQFNQPIQPQQAPPLKIKKHNTSFIVAFVSSGFAVLFLALFIWQFSERSSLEANYQTDLDAAVLEAISVREAQLREEFEEQINSDTVAFRGPDVLGSITFDYPKTWSAAIDENDSGKTRLDATLHPNAIKNSISAFALKVQVLDNQYAQELKSFNSEIDKGEVTSTPVSFSGVDGVRLDGLIDRELTGSIVLLPLRDRTLVLRTESDNYKDTFEQVLDSLQFTP